MLRYTWIVLCLALSVSPGTLAVEQSPPVDPQLRALLMDAVSQADSFADHFDAQVWLLDMSTRLRRYIPDEEERLRFLRLVHREAKRAELKPDLVLAVIHVESLFDRYALSRAGAQGVILGCTELSLLKKQVDLGRGILDVLDVLAKSSVIACGKPVKPEYEVLFVPFS